MYSNPFILNFSFICYLISILLSFTINFPKKTSNLFSLKFIIPSLFIILIALYVLPLSIRSLLNLEPSEISPNYYVFHNYIPSALLLSSLFNIAFSITYRIKSRAISSSPSSTYSSIYFNFSEKLIIIILSLISFWMIYQLSKQVGGVINLVLYGYRVTELFVNKGHFAVGFEWIITLILLIWGNSLATRKKSKIISSLIILIILIISFIIMGRRGALVTILGSSLFLFHQLYKPIRLVIIVGFGLIGFYFLTLVGYLRGDSYEDISSALEIIQEKKTKIDENKSINYFYTLSKGNFAVPFETFPQIIESFGEKYNVGLGTYSIKSLSIVVPRILWENRPLPLSNWYMNTYYGQTPLNEGRQFFILTAPYMDFGALGILLIGVIMGVFWSFIVKISNKYKGDILLTTLVALVISSSFNIIANDVFAWFIAFFKGPGFPIIFLLLYRNAIRSIKFKYL